MTMSAGNDRQVAGFDPQGCVDFLERLHPVKTAAGVAADTGDSARTVENWLAFKSTPTVPAFCRLVRAYGPAFVAAAIPGLAWVERAAALCTYDGLGREIALLEARRDAVGRALRGERT